MQICSQRTHTGKTANKRRYLWDVPYSPGSNPLKRDSEVIHRKWADLLLMCICWLLEKHPLSLGQANPLIDLILSSSNSTWPFGLYSGWLVPQTSLSPVIRKRAIISAHFALVSGILERVYFEFAKLCHHFVFWIHQKFPFQKLLKIVINPLGFQA